MTNGPGLVSAMTVDRCEKVSQESPGPIVEKFKLSMTGERGMREDEILGGIEVRCQGLARNKLTGKLNRGHDVQQSFTPIEEDSRE